MTNGDVAAVGTVMVVLDELGDVFNAGERYRMARKIIAAVTDASEASKREALLATYDAGLLGNGGGGDVQWWHDYIRAELARAHEFYQSQLAPSPVST